MFIYNVKLNKNKSFKTLFIIFFIIVIIVLGLAIYKIMFKNNIINSGDEMTSLQSQDISNSNYTNVLKSVHENIDKYIGKEVNFSGYVYRVFDLKENQFILARNMVIDSNFQTLVVGFLCECDNAKELENNTWIHISGTIQKGDYHGEIPIVKVKKIQKINKPSDEFVYPPDSTYIPTGTI